MAMKARRVKSEVLRLIRSVKAMGKASEGMEEGVERMVQ